MPYTLLSMLGLVLIALPSSNSSSFFLVLLSSKDAHVTKMGWRMERVRLGA